MQVSCNLADLSHPSFAPLPVPYAIAARTSNKASLAAAVDAALEVGDVPCVLCPAPALPCPAML